MGEALRNPDRALVDRIRSLEQKVDTLRRLPTGAKSIGLDVIRPGVKAGAPSDADYTTPPQIGSRVLDTTNKRLYLRTAGGTWKYAALGVGGVGTAELADNAVTEAKIFVLAARISGTQSIPFNTTTLFNSFALVEQNGSMFAAGNPDRLTFPRAGYYQINMWWFWDASAGGTRAQKLAINGTNSGVQDTRLPDTFNGSGGAMSFMFKASLNDTVGMFFYQNCTAGTALNVLCQMSAYFVSN